MDRVIRRHGRIYNFGSKTNKSMYELTKTIDWYDI